MAKSGSGAASVEINSQWCKGCGICVAFCPREALFLNGSGKAEEEPEKCTACGACMIYCPDFAIALPERRRSVHG